MKMEYKKPEIWVTEKVPLNLLSDSVTPWADSKKNETPWDDIDDEEDNHLDSKFNWSVWDDDEDEEDN